MDWWLVIVFVVFFFFITGDFQYFLPSPSERKKRKKSGSTDPEEEADDDEGDPVYLPFLKKQNAQLKECLAILAPIAGQTDDCPEPTTGDESAAGTKNTGRRCPRKHKVTAGDKFCPVCGLTMGRNRLYPVVPKDTPSSPSRNEKKVVSENGRLLAQLKNLILKVYGEDELDGMMAQKTYLGNALCKNGHDVADEEHKCLICGSEELTVAGIDKASVDGTFICKNGHEMSDEDYYCPICGAEELGGIDWIRNQALDGAKLPLLVIECEKVSAGVKQLKEDTAAIIEK